MGLLLTTGLPIDNNGSVALCINGSELVNVTTVSEITKTRKVPLFGKFEIYSRTLKLRLH